MPAAAVLLAIVPWWTDDVEVKAELCIHPRIKAGSIMATAHKDEFDLWLSEPTAKEVAAPAPAAEQAKSSSWFSSALPAALPTPSFLAGASSLLPTSADLSASELFSGVASKVRATIEEQVTAFNKEADIYCTKEAQEKERAADEQFAASTKLAVVQEVKAVLPPAAAAVLPKTPDKTDDEDAPWLDSPPHLRELLEEAVRRLSDSENTFSEATTLGDAAEREEHHVLMGCARAALAFDERLNQRRFELVPKRMDETTFWTNYFARVLRERRLFKLEPLKSKTPLPPAPVVNKKPAVVTGFDEDDDAAFEAAVGGAFNSSSSSSSSSGAKATGGGGAAIDVSDGAAADEALLDLAAVEAEADKLLELANTTRREASPAPAPAVPLPLPKPPPPKPPVVTAPAPAPPPPKPPPLPKTPAAPPPPAPKPLLLRRPLPPPRRPSLRRR